MLPTCNSATLQRHHTTMSCHPPAPSGLVAGALLTLPAAMREQASICMSPKTAHAGTQFYRRPQHRKHIATDCDHCIVVMEGANAEFAKELHTQIIPHVHHLSNNLHINSDQVCTLSCWQGTFLGLPSPSPTLIVCPVVSIFIQTAHTMETPSLVHLSSGACFTR
jgi:hypothetical protein